MLLNILDTNHKISPILQKQLILKLKVGVGELELVEQLPKEQFTKEQVEIRLEQVRHFRK